jgi:hypothetical protein
MVEDSQLRDVKKTEEESLDFLTAMIKSEADLAGLPFFALSRQEIRERMRTEYTITVERDGKRLDVSWKVTPNIAYGYPGPFDRKVHKAIEYLINEQGIPIENPIPFSLCQLCRLTGVADSGTNKSRITHALRRIVATTVDSEGIFYSKREKRYITATFHIYDQVVFRGRELPNGEIADTNYLFLSRWYLDSINAFHLRPIDFCYLRQLNSDIASRLYELLSLKFYGVILNEKLCWRVPYKELCDLLPITSQRYVSHAKRYLEPAHRELMETQFLSNVVWEETGRRDWYIVYYPGRKAYEEARPGVVQEELRLELPDHASSSQGRAKNGQEGSGGQEEGRPFPAGQDEVGGGTSDLTLEEQELLSLLRERRIGAKSALKMVKTYPERIRERVEIFDWMVQHSGEKITSPTGFLRRMIEEDWPPPDGFVSEAERQRQEAERARREEERRHQENARWVEEATVEHVCQQQREASPWKELWEQITHELAQRMPRQSFCTWIQPLFIAELQESVVVLDCPSRFIKEWLEKEVPYRSVIEEAVRTVCGKKQVIFACGGGRASR